MKGHNTLTINQDTLIEMAQEWLDKRWKYGNLKVMSVKKDNSKNNLSDCLSVELNLEEQECQEPEIAPGKVVES